MVDPVPTIRSGEPASQAPPSGPLADKGPTGPVPEDNQPGHHPAVEQDKPTGPPRLRHLRDGKAQREEPAHEEASDGATRRFAFSFEPKVLAFSVVLGVTPRTAHVEVTSDELTVRFGLWHLSTSLDNLRSLEETGPYQLVKVAGPPHLSFKDRGVTFATTTRRGVCIGFREPVAGLFPGSLVKHPAATVTVDDVDGFIALLAQRAHVEPESE